MSLPASAPSLQTSASKARTVRSQSPVKRLVVTRLRPHPILSCNIYDSELMLPPDLMDMLGVIEDYSQGIGVIDASMTVCKPYILHFLIYFTSLFFSPSFFPHHEALFVKKS
jgi:hypothetical protein